MQGKRFEEREESNETAMEVEEEDLIREGSLQRLEKRKKEYMSRRLVKDVIEEMLKDVEESGLPSLKVRDLVRGQHPKTEE